MQNYNNLTKKIVVYIFITLIVFSCFNYAFSTLDNTKTVTITMKQSSENDVKVLYKEDEYDSRNLEVSQTLPSSDVYETIKLKVPKNNVYSLDLKLNTKEGKTNKVDIQKLTVSTLFTKHEIKDFNDSHYKVTKKNGTIETISSKPLFSNFELTKKPKIIAILISLFIVFLLRNAINNLVNKHEQFNDNSKVLIFSSFLLLVFFTNAVTLETEYYRLKARAPLEKPVLKDYDSVLDTSYMKEVENYTKDHFLFSEFFTEDYFVFNELLQKNSFSSAYFTNINGEDITLSPFKITDKKMAAGFLKNIHKLSNLLEEKDIPHLFFLAPSKDYTLSKSFDNVIPNYVDNDSAKIYEFFTEGIPKNNDYVQFYDLINYMDKDSLKNGTTHFSTDHHWTTETAFDAYKQVLKVLSENGVEPSNETEFQSEAFINQFVGSDGRKIAYGNRYNQTKDDFTLIYPKDLGDYTVTSLKDTSIKSGNFLELLDTSRIYTTKQYSDYYAVYNLPFSQFGSAKITNNTIDDNTSILVLGDSYVRPISWFIATNYKNVIYIDQRDFDKGFTEEYINANSDNIDVVINLNYFHPGMSDAESADENIFNYFK